MYRNRRTRIYVARRPRSFMKKLGIILPAAAVACAVAVCIAGNAYGSEYTGMVRETVSLFLGFLDHFRGVCGDCVTALLHELPTA